MSLVGPRQLCLHLFCLHRQQRKHLKREATGNSPDQRLIAAHLGYVALKLRHLQLRILHYTPVLPVLLLRGGRDISQGNFIKRGTLGQKVGDIEKQYYQCPTFFAKSGGH